MNHYDLCKAIADWQLKTKKADVVLYEYNTQCSIEQPDVLSFYNRNNRSILFEIKMSKNDFINDTRKKSRKEINSLGLYRFYVCPKGLIHVNDISNYFGLIWFYDNKFHIRKKSPVFSVNLYRERKLLVDALIRYHNNRKDNILIRNYKWII